MPAILKSSIERAYSSCGWDLLHSIHIDVGTHKFPTFEDLLRELPRVIGESSYSAETKGDYIGALVTRVSSLTNGIMGSVLCSEEEIPGNVLFDENTIVDLSRVGSSETKAMLMGVLVMKLNEHRIAKSIGMNLNLRHITILEEAHNLLRRTSTSQSAESANVAGKSVEMISNSIAEMRTYGEGFIIVDQSPTAVDISAIKNTNTKIVMRLPERADFETIGNAFALDENQIREISRLRRGAAIVSQMGWLEPVMVAIDRATDAYEAPSKRILAEPLDDGSIESIVTLVINQFNNAFFNERPLRKILDEGKLPGNRKELIMQQYRILARKANGDEYLNNTDISRFIIETVGCKDLASIFPLNISPKDSLDLNKRKYIVWQKKVIEHIEYYGQIRDEDLKKTIAKDLVIYMAKVNKSPTYERAIQILGGK